MSKQYRSAETLRLEQLLCTLNEQGLKPHYTVGDTLPVFTEPLTSDWAIVAFTQDQCKTCPYAIEQLRAILKSTNWQILEFAFEEEHSATETQIFRELNIKFTPTFFKVDKKGTIKHIQFGYTETFDSLLVH